MQTHDQRLRTKLPGNNGTNGLVLNSHFNPWSEDIERNLNENRYAGKTVYDSESELALLRLCRVHANVHKRPKQGESTIMLTHPFYLSLSHMNQLESDDMRDEARQYLDTLLSLLSLSRTNLGVVMLETIHHYAAASSLLLERGLVDRVIFTEYDSGNPLDLEEMEDFEDDEIYFSGGYNEKCLTTAVEVMEAKVPVEKRWGISDLILESPLRYTKTLRPFYVPFIDSCRMITAEEVADKFKLTE